MPLSFVLEFKPSARVSDLQDVLAAAAWCPFDGTRPLAVEIDGTSLPPDERIANVQLPHGAVLRLATDQDRPRACLSVLDPVRLIHLDGPQAGFAWPIYPVTRHIGIDGDLLQDRAVSRAEISLSLAEDGICLIEVTTGSSASVVVDGWPQDTRAVEVRAGSIVTLRFIDLTLTLRVDLGGTPDTVQSVEGFVTVRPRPAAIDSEGVPLQESLSAPKEPKSTGWDWKEQLAQPLAMVLAYLLMGVIVGFSPYFLVIVVVPAIAAAVSYRRHQRTVADSVRTYNDEVRAFDRQIGRLEAHVRNEVRAIVSAHPALTTIMRDIQRRNGVFWSRPPGHDQFLKVMVGVGPYLSPSNLHIQGDGVDSHVTVWREDVHDTRIVDEGPLLWDARSESIAFLGSSGIASRFVGDLILRLASNHSPDDLTLMALLPDEADVLAEYAFVPPLPHTKVDSQLVGSTLIHVGPSVNDGVRQWISSLSGKANGAARGHRIVLVHERAPVNIADLETLVEASAGTTTICWIGSAESLVPKTILRRIIVRLEPGGQFHLSSDTGAYQGQARSVAPVEAILASSLAMEPCIDEGTTGRGGAIPRAVATGAIIEPRATSRSAGRHLKVPIGSTDEGTLEIDLVSDGPHLLVAGTTGSGKSELLRTLILGIAAEYSPEEVCLLLIDFKGGASLGDLAGMHGEPGLPHVVGSVTNLSGHDVNRLILYLREEVLRRQRILAPFNGEYTRYRSRGHSSLPRLVLVIDEFGGFIDNAGGTNRGASRDGAILEVAARGRSLGIHLVIATQSPKGVVTGSVSANVNARIALRVLDGADSESVIGSADAARIAGELKGRAFARFENGGLVQFQSSFTGSDYLARQTDAPVTVRPLTFGFEFERSSRVGSAADDQNDDSDTMPDDAVLLRRAIRDYYTEHDPSLIPLPPVGFGDRLKQPCLFPSALSPDFQRAPWRAAPLVREPGEICLGTQDQPRSQQSGVPYLLPLQAGAALIYGTAGSGRSSTLLAAALDFRLKNPDGRIVVIEDRRSALGYLGSADWVINTHDAGSAHHLLAQLNEDYGPAIQDTLVLIDRLDLAADSIEIEAWSRTFANGGSRNVFVLATADPRLTLEPVLRRSFAYQLELLEGYPGVMHEASDEWSLISVSAVDVRAKRPEVTLGYRTESQPTFRRNYFSSAGPRPLGFGAFSPRARVLRPNALVVGWDRVRHEEFVVEIQPGSVFGVAGSAGGSRTAVIRLICRLLASQSEWSVGQLNVETATTNARAIDIALLIRRFANAVDTGSDLAEMVLTQIATAENHAIAIDSLTEPYDRHLRDIRIGTTSAKQSWDYFGPDFWEAFWRGAQERQFALIGGGQVHEFLSAQSARSIVRRQNLRLQLVPPDAGVAESISGLMTTFATQRLYFNTMHVPYGPSSGRLYSEDGQSAVEVEIYDQEVSL